MSTQDQHRAALVGSAKGLARDAGECFHGHGGLDRKAGDEFRARVLPRGRTKEPDALLRAFYGHAPDIKPLLKHRGLTLGKR